MNRQSDKLIAQLKQLLINDSVRVPNGLIKVLKSELIGVLNSYFDFEGDSLELKIETDAKGGYKINISGAAHSIKETKLLD